MSIEIKLTDVTDNESPNGVAKATHTPQRMRISPRWRVTSRMMLME